MKWFLVIVLSVAHCGALEHTLKTAKIPTAQDVNVNLTRIVGGNSANIQRYPYTVQVLYRRRLACGGSLVTRRHVLTAAHCFFDENNRLLDVRDFTIIAGSSNLERGGTTRSISRVVVHERYNIVPRDSDLAVMVLASTVSTSSSIATAVLPFQGEQVPDNSTVWTVGWGRTNPNIASASPTLQEVQIRTINLTVCQQNYLFLQQSRPPTEQYPVTTNMICSGMLGEGGRDACQGDSGGPLLYSGIVVGITSWGWDCAHPTFPGVNVRVSAYTNWINQTVTRYNAGPPMGSFSGILLLVCLISSLILGSNLK